MSSIAGELVTERLGVDDGGRQVTVYVPPAPAEAVVFAGDGQLAPQWSESVEAAGVPPTIFCASPGGGYKPPGVVPSPLPRAYLVAGTLKPFFRENAARWATALRDAGAEVVLAERVGSHGGAFWNEELPLMVAWAFGRA